MTHLPSGKFYIGSLQRASLWHRYKTSSKTVKSMIAKNPEEWKKEILKQYSRDYDPQLLVNEEYALIDDAVKQFGWESIWNQRGSSNLGSSGYSPEAREKQRAKAKDPAIIEKSKKGKKAFLEANPDFFNRVGASLKETWNEPKMREFASKRATDQFSKIENRLKASQIKKAHLALNPEDITRSTEGMKKARANPLIESKRVEKIKVTMSKKSKEFSSREKLKHELNPDLGKLHGEKLKALNQSDPSRRMRMSESAKKKSINRPDLVAQSIAAMNSLESRAKMKASLLEKYGKWVVVTFSNGEKIQIFGAKETGRILGIDKVSRKVTQNGFKKPLICITGEHAGKEIILLRYLDT